jgi:hypothetical protein
MAVPERSTAVGVFADHAQAESALDELRRAGFTDEQLGVAAPHPAAEAAPTSSPDDPTDMIGQGAVTGAFTGGSLGVLAGLALVAGTVTPIGPALLGGVLIGILGSAAIGAAADQGAGGGGPPLRIAAA